MFIYRPEYYENFANEHGESTRGETHIKIAKHRNGALENIRLRAMLHIQKFEEWDGDNGPALPPGGSWKPVGPQQPSKTGGDDNARLFIQKGSRMNDDEFDSVEDENPF
jgi:replicative DNA helicase